MSHPGNFCLQCGAWVHFCEHEETAMAEATEVKTFEGEDEARAFAAQFNKDFWAYDGSATVWQEMATGKWKVSTRMRDSCD